MLFTFKLLSHYTGEEAILYTLVFSLSNTNVCSQDSMWITGSCATRQLRFGRLLHQVWAAWVGSNRGSVCAEGYVVMYGTLWKHAITGNSTHMALAALIMVWWNEKSLFRTALPRSFVIKQRWFGISGGAFRESEVKWNICNAHVLYCIPSWIFTEYFHSASYQAQCGTNSQEHILRMQ